VRLPKRLDYDEVSNVDEVGLGSAAWWPEVRCTVPGCDWRYDASWDELDHLGDTDWDALHPAHDTSPEATPSG
jgi:hypothetical protein